MPWRRTLALRMTAPLREAVMRLSQEDARTLTEIRIRTGRPVQWVFTHGQKYDSSPVSEKDMDALLSTLCAHSRYAYEAQIAQGYIPLPGGHRAGVCGRVSYENGGIARMSSITSICIRIARALPQASLPIRKHLSIGSRPARVLFLGPPGAGKTTMLRDAAKYLSAECGFRVAAADEREELFAQEEAIDVDVLRGADKSDAVTMLVRTMSPQVIVCDEVGKEADAMALLSVASCGVGLLASAHADGFSDLVRRPVLEMLVRNRAFDRYIFLSPHGRCAGVLDSDGKELQEK